jgi:AcrR family transcriptional regulator
MIQNKPPSSPTARGEPVRQRVIDAAERLLRQGKADFSMRDLAAEAGVSFATPFNHFGNKTAIMHALSGLRIDRMSRHFAEAPPLAQAPDRVLLAMRVAAAVMIEEPEVNRAVMGWIGSASPSPGEVLAHSTALWSLAVGAGEGLSGIADGDTLRKLPRQLAFAFRGVLSFWTAGELPDADLASEAQDLAKALLGGLIIVPRLTEDAKSARPDRRQG